MLLKKRRSLLKSWFTSFFCRHLPVYYVWVFLHDSRRRARGNHWWLAFASTSTIFANNLKLKNFFHHPSPQLLIHLSLHLWFNHKPTVFMKWRQSMICKILRTLHPLQPTLLLSSSVNRKILWNLCENKLKRVKRAVIGEEGKISTWI